MNCPSLDDLRRFLVGEISADSIDTLADHIERCARCQSLVATVDDDDGFVRDLREATESDSSLESAAYRRLIAAAEELGRARRGSPDPAEARTEGLPAPPGDLRSAWWHGQETGHSAVDSAGSETRTERASRAERVQLGHFELIEQVGAGSFGVVWRARDTELDRIMAVKIPHRSRLDSTPAEDVMREARASAQLHHPNIVRVYEVGRQEETVYIVSDFVAGLTLDQWAASFHPAAREVARLCTRLADALHHAHAAGVVHRDLKPTNIMVDADGEPHIMDFGLAKRDAVEVTITTDGNVLGTPAYMSPEQASGEAHQAGPRSDIFSLGVVLYELLTGERPFRGPTHLMLQRIVNDPPVSPRKLNSTIPRDVETICLKCLEKDPARRYASARALREDLGRFLRGEPIHARPVSAAGRVWRWCKRKPVVAGLAAALAAAILAGTVGIVHQEALVRREAERNRTLLYASDMSVAHEAWNTGNLAAMGEALVRHKPARGEKDLRGFEWHYLWRLYAESLPVQPLRHDAEVLDMAYSADGRIVASVGRDKALKLWDAKTRKLIRVIPMEYTRDRMHLSLSPDGALAATAAGSTEVKIWNVATGELKRILDGHSGKIMDVIFSPDGKLLASAAQDKTIKLWDATSGKLLRTLHGHTDAVRCLSFSQDGRLASGGWDGKVLLWDVDSESSPVTVETGPHHIPSLTFCPDSSHLIVGRYPSELSLWDIATGKKERIFAEGVGHISCMDVSPDGRVLAAGGEHCTIKLWDLETGKRLAILKGHTANVTSVAFSRDGTSRASASWDGTVRFWSTKTDSATLPFLGNSYWSVGLDFSPVKSVFGVSGPNGTGILYDLTTGLQTVLRGRHTSVQGIAFSPDGRFVATGGGDGNVRLWEADSGKLVRELPADKDNHTTRWLKFSFDGRFLVSGSANPRAPRHLVAWSLSDNQCHHLKEHTGMAYCLARSPVGSILAAGGGLYDDFSEVTLWDSTSGEPQCVDRFTDNQGVVHSMAFSPDGKMLACGFRNGSVKQLNIMTRTWGAELKAQGYVRALTFSPDRRTLATASNDGTIKLWQTATLSGLITLRAPTTVCNAAFSPDGKNLIAACVDGTIMRWQGEVDTENIADANSGVDDL